MDMRTKCFQVLFLAVYLARISYGKNIVIGVLYRKEYESLSKTLEYLINYEINGIFLPDQYRLTRVTMDVKGKNLLSREIVAKFSTAVCLFDLYANDPDAFALSDLLRIPLIKADNLDTDPPNRYVLSMRPQNLFLARALYDLIMYFRFDTVAILYDVRKTRLASHFYSLARTEERFGVYLMPEIDVTNHDKTVAALKTLKKTYITNVVLICDHKDLAKVMNEALSVDLNEAEYKWIASDLEVAGPNKTYPSILGMVGFSLHISSEIASQRLEAIAYNVGGGDGIPLAPVVYGALNDSLYMVSRALRGLMTAQSWDAIYPSTSQDTCPLKSKPSEAGTKLLESLQKITHHGVTGQMDLYSNGKRKSTRILDILNVVKKNVKKVGTWKSNLEKNEEKAISMNEDNPAKWVGEFAELVKCHNPGNPGEKLVRPRRMLRVTTVIEPPFLEWRNGSISTRPVSNTSLQGFCLDLLNELARELDLDYKILLRTDNNYGKQNGGEWNGMIGDLVNKHADIALAPITINSEREGAIDFTKPFMDFSMSLIMQKEAEEQLDLFAFVRPFDGTVWILIIGVVLFVTIMMYIVDLFSPFGHRAEALDTGEGPGDEFNLFNSLWFATASMLQQGGDNTPKSPSGRILATAFWFFILIIISTYTANLAAFFTIKNSKKAINSLEDLANQDKIKYGVLKNGVIDTFFEKSQVPLYRKMFSQMRQTNSYVKSTSIGVNKTRRGGYAYLTEQPYLDYYNQKKPCNTTLLNNLISSKSYGFGLQRHSPYVNELSVVILKLRENGFIDAAKYKWWDERSECVTKEASGTGSTTSLGIKNMAGVFIVLLGGVVFSFLLIVIEIKCKRIVDMLTKTGQCSSDAESYDVGPTENLAEIHSMMVPKRPTTLILPESYANVQESKL